VAAGKLEDSMPQAEAARSLSKLPTAMADAKVELKAWEDEQARYHERAKQQSDRTKSSRKDAAQWRGDGWIKGSPKTPKHPEIIGPTCSLALGPPPSLYPAGVYIHGSVGSGKSTLMDLFCLFSMQNLRVRRQHFHEFSVWLHESIHGLGNKAAANGIRKPRKHVLALLVDDLAESCDALCLDELAITNVADAAIFSELLRLLAQRHIAVVCTTNRPPEDLYKDGLHRDRHVPALITHLQERFLVAPINGKDFRAQMLQKHSEQETSSPSSSSSSSSADGSKVFFEGGTSEEVLEQVARPLEVTGALEPGEMKVSWGRKLDIPGTAGGFARFHFDDLCRKPLASEDYLHVARRFHTLYIHDVPRLKLEEHNEARRFTNLVDALYEHSVRLICHTQVPVGEVLKSVETLQNAHEDDGHDADRLGIFEKMYDDSPNFQIQIKEMGGRDKWRASQEKQMEAEQRALAARLNKMGNAEAVQGTTGSGWSAAPAGSDLSAPDEGVAGVMVAAVGSLQESGFAARRAVSRLKEMQTSSYLETARQRRETMC